MEFACKVGFPLIFRPSFVLSGAGMKLINTDEELAVALVECQEISPDYPITISKFEDDSMEIEFDGVANYGNIILYAIS